jgi:cation-transporting ATPase 13A2
MVRLETLRLAWWLALVRDNGFFLKQNCGAGSDPLTGFATTKGALIRSMLFPKPMGFKFYRDSVRFIGVLAGIAALGFSASAVQFIRLGIPWHTILVRALDLVTVVVPPALPATLSIGTSFAISRLRKQGIFCISPSRVNVAGKINVCCFDKTGTLTEDGLDILGIRGLDRDGERFGELIDDVYDLPQSLGKANFHQALATCHSLKMVDGEPIGDPLDVKMFTFTKWTLEEGMNAGMGKIKGPSGMEQPAALVQTVVRPPGTGHFRLEDALKSGGRVRSFVCIVQTVTQRGFSMPTSWSLASSALLSSSLHCVE